MKANFKTSNGRMTFELTGEVKDIVEQLAAVQDVFEAETICGCCQTAAIRFQFREVDSYKFYELVCLNPECRARFTFGQARKGGGLFPKRKDEDGKWLPNRGWSKYVKPSAGQATGRHDHGDEPF